MVLHDKFKNSKNFSKSELPSGFFSASTFIITRRENHGFGYHSHIKMLINGKYIRTGHILTYAGGEFYVSNHGKQKPFFDILENKNRFLKNTKKDLEEMLKGTNQEDWLKPSKKALRLYKLPREHIASNVLLPTNNKEPKAL